MSAKKWSATQRRHFFSTMSKKAVGRSEVVSVSLSTPILTDEVVIDYLKKKRDNINQVIENLTTLIG